MQGAQKLRSEAHLRVRRNDEVAAQRRRWTFYEAIKIDENGALEAIVVMPQARVIDFNSTLARSSAGFNYELKLSLASK